MINSQIEKPACRITGGLVADTLPTKNADQHTDRCRMADLLHRKGCFRHSVGSDLGLTVDVQ